MLKCWLPALLGGGAWWAWSAAGGLRAEEDVRGLLTVIDSGVHDAALTLAARISGRRSLFGAARRRPRPMGVVDRS